MIGIKDEINIESELVKDVLYSEFLRMYKGLYNEKYAIIYARQQLGSVTKTKNKVNLDYEVRLVGNRFYYYMREQLIGFTYIGDYKGNFSMLKNIFEQSLIGKRVVKRNGQIRVRSNR